MKKIQTQKIEVIVDTLEQAYESGHVVYAHEKTVLHDGEIVYKEYIQRYPSDRPVENVSLLDQFVLSILLMNVRETSKKHSSDRRNTIDTFKMFWFKLLFKVSYFKSKFF